jgi:hypothetical protein
LPAQEWEALQPKLQVPCHVLGHHKDLHKSVGEVVVVTNQVVKHK